MSVPRDLEIVRLNWPDLSKINVGTHLDISHIGLVFRHHGELWFRHASQTTHKVVEQPLITYLQTARTVPSIAGIHLHIIAKPAPSRCTSS